MDAFGTTVPSWEFRAASSIKNDLHTYVDGISSLIIVPSVQYELGAPIFTVHARIAFMQNFFRHQDICQIETVFSH